MKQNHKNALHQTTPGSGRLRGGLRQLWHRLPMSQWLRDYDRSQFSPDLSAAVVVTALLIPQSLAYAMLAGLPAESGLYASLLPLVIYAVLGTSRTLSVGPVAVLSLMTAAALAKATESTGASPLAAAAVLALLSGGLLLVMGILRLGFITDFLSHTVISGFITASGLVIALSQIQHILGIHTNGDTLPELLKELVSHGSSTHFLTAVIGVLVVAFLYFCRRWLTPLLIYMGLSKQRAALLSKVAPVVAVVVTTLAAYAFSWQTAGVALTGELPSSLPSIGFALPSWALIEALAVPALLLSLIGYVESISVGKTLAAKRRQTINPDQELIALGAANVGSAFSGGLPVTGGFSRTIVNYEAGAVTQAASIMAAMGIALSVLFLSPALYYLPKATLAATIIVAVLSLVDFSVLRKTWRISRSDFWALATTIGLTLFAGVEVGIACGMTLSIALYLYHTSHPHIAEVGLLPGSEHFRNILRYQVETDPQILCLRPDESLFFANAHRLEEAVRGKALTRAGLRHVILQCSAVNDIDFSAWEMLVSLNDQLAEQGVKLHLAEVKGPVMDKLKRTNLIAQLHGEVYVSLYAAFEQLRTPAKKTA